MNPNPQGSGNQNKCEEKFRESKLTIAGTETGRE